MGGCVVLPAGTCGCVSGLGPMNHVPVMIKRAGRWRPWKFEFEVRCWRGCELRVPVDSERAGEALVTALGASMVIEEYVVWPPRVRPEAAWRGYVSS
jgi:hypothetical protein